MSMSMADNFVETPDGFVEDTVAVIDGILIYRHKRRRRNGKRKVRMAADVGMAALLERSFHEDEEEDVSRVHSGQKDLRALSAAIMAASERAELMAHETDRWLTGHQEFDDLDLIPALIGEAEGRLIQMQKMTVIRELDKYMQQISQNAPQNQSQQLSSLVTSTKDTFSSAIASLEKFIHRSENINSAYTKYKDSAFTLGKALTDASSTLQVISGHCELTEIDDQVDAVRESRDMLTRMKACLRNMKDAMAGIESLTLTVCDLGMDDYVKQYKHRRAELSEALARLEHIQSQLETFADLRQRCESDITDLNNALNSQPKLSDSKELDFFRDQANQLQIHIQDMERIVESLRNGGVNGEYETQLGTIRDGYSTLITILSSAASSSYQSSIAGSPRAGDSNRSSPRRSPRRQTPVSDAGTPRQSLRQWLREKTAELQELMAEPFPFDDQNIQKYWHTIQKYQGDLVVRGEEFSLYGAEAEGDQPTMDQITPLIDTCSDLSFRLDSHAKLCVQYTADQNGLRSELSSLEESKESLQHSEIPLRDQYHLVGDLLVQVSSLKRRTHDQLHNKLPTISVNLAKKEAGAILTETSELEAAVSKLKLEVKAFHQSLDNSISNLEVLTKQLRDLLIASSQVEEVQDNFILSQPITYENVEGALEACQRQIEELQERQRRIGKLLSERKISIGVLPSPDNDELEQTLHKSTKSAENTLNKLQQHHSKLSSLHQTLKTFTIRCDEARDRLHSAENLLHKSDAATNTEQPVEITIETVTVECKTRLHECVTCIEQAEIAVTQLEQRNNTDGKLDSQREEIKEIQAKHKALAAKLREAEQKQAMIADQQRSLEVMFRRFDDWLKLAQGTISEQTTLTSGLNDIRDHIIKLHELEKSLDTSHSWLLEMKKQNRLLSQNLPASEINTKTESIADKESLYEQVKGTLTSRISELSAQMEVVISWIQKSGELTTKLNNIKHSLADITNKETSEQTVQAKIKLIKTHMVDVENLQRELTDLVKKTPPSVNEKQRKPSQAALNSCSTISSDLTVMYNTLSQVSKVWAEFNHAAAEVRGHLKHCENQLSAVELPGVSLDARGQRYQETCLALETFPDGLSPQYLHDLLSTCPIASPGLYQAATGLSEEQRKMLSNAKKGSVAYSKELKTRSALESDLQTVNVQLKDIGTRLQSSLLLEDWNVKSCDLITKSLQTEEMELKTLSEKITPRIKSQQEAHRQRDETMVLDLRESIDVYEETNRELMALIAQEKEVLVLAREFCQYITESLDKIQTCLQQSERLCEQVESGQLTQQQIETGLEENLTLVKGENSILRRDLLRVGSYKEQITPSLSEPAQERLNNILADLVSRINATEHSMVELLDHHGRLGQTKLLYEKQSNELQTNIDKIKNKLSTVGDMKTRSLKEAKAKQSQIQILETESGDIELMVEGLVDTARELTPLISNEKERQQYEASLRILCTDQWAEVKDQLNQLRADTDSVHADFTDIEERQRSITGSEFNSRAQEISELQTVDLSTLSLNDLDRIAQRACQCSADVSQLWQNFLAAKDQESSLVARLGGDSTKSSKSATETGNKLTSLAAACQNLEAKIEKAAAHTQSACDSLNSNLQRIQNLGQQIKQTDAATASEELDTQQERLQSYKDELSRLYQASNEIVASFKTTAMPPDVTSAMNSIQNENEAVLDDVQLRLGQTERLMEQWDVVNTMQQDLDKWMSNTSQALSSEIVDTQVAQSQQRSLEDHVVEYTHKLAELTAKSHDLESAASTPQSQRLLESITHYQKNLTDIKQDLDKRRQHVAELQQEEETFHTDLEEVSRMISELEHLTRCEISDVNVEKCEQLSTTYQDELRKVPEIEQKLNDLVTLSVRLGDSSHHSDSVTRVLDLKKDWSALKSQVTQQANALKDTTRVLLSAPAPAVVSHDEWKTTTEALEADTEDNLRELQQRVDGSQLLHTDDIMSQLKLYDNEDVRLKVVHDKIEDLNVRREQLQSASVDPLMLKDWAGQMLKIDGELKQLYMKSDEGMKRKSTIIDKAHKLAQEGLKREKMDDPVAPLPSQMLDLSMDSEQYISEAAGDVKSSAHVTQRPLLSQDEHAAKLFSVQRSSESNKAEAQMQALISEHEGLQATLADVNRQVSAWTWTLDQDHHTQAELSNTAREIQTAKAKLDKLYKSEAAEQEPSLSVLTMSLETLELRCLSELQRMEANDSLTSDHRETLNSIEEEVVACQKYLDYLDTMPGGAEEKLPTVEHRVSKLQRMYQTLKLINPNLCEGSHVSEYLGQLMNDLQLLQGRLEVIPEDRELLTPGSDLYRWQENMADHVSQHDGDSDVDFVDNVVCNLNKSLCSLDMRNLSDDRRQQMRHAHEMVSAYKELLIATRYGLQTGRLTESETAVQDRENILSLFTMFETYRLHLASISSTTSNTNVIKSFNNFIEETQAMQNDLWCKAENLQRLINMSTTFNKHCDDLISCLTQLHSDYTANKVNHSRLEKKLNQIESEYHGLLTEISILLSTSMRSPELRQKSADLQEIWQSLKDLAQIQSAPSIEDESAKLFSELLIIQMNNKRKLDADAPLHHCASQALDMLVELDSLNWLYKDLYSGKEDSDLDMKSNMLSLRPKVNAIKSLLQSRLMESTSSNSEDLQNIYKWLGEIKPFKKQLTSISTVHEYLHELIGYQSDLSQRSYITGLMMSLVTSSDHDVIVTSQQAVKTLHEAKMAASKQLTSTHTLRDAYKVYEKTKRRFESWISEASCVTKDCPIGSQAAVEWLITMCKSLHDEGLMLSEYKQTFTQECTVLSSHQLCTQSAIREVSRQAKDLNDKQMSSMKDLTTLLDTMEGISANWAEYNAVYDENCDILDRQECLLECAPHLTTETCEEYNNQLAALKVALDNGSREADKIQPISQKLRVHITVNNSLQALDTIVKEVRLKEYKLFSQKLPLMIERWQKARSHMDKYDKSIANVQQIITDTQVFLHKSSSAVTLKDLELSLSEYQRYLNKLDTIKWGDIERAASSIGQLTGIILHQGTSLRKKVDNLRRHMTGLVADSTEKCAKSSHCAQMIHTVEHKLNRLQNEPCLTIAIEKLDYQKLLDRRSRTEQLLYDLVLERQTMDDLQTSYSTGTPLSKEQVDLMNVLEIKYTKVMDIISSRLVKLQEEVVKFAEPAQLRSAYQDWKNQIVQLISQQIIGEAKDLQELRSKCLLHINLAETERISLSKINKASCSRVEHNKLVKSLTERELELQSLLTKQKLFNKLKDTVLYSLRQLEAHLVLPDKSYNSHVEMSDKIPALKSTFELHQRASLIMRQICQELLPHCESASRTKLLATVQKASSQWQSVLSKLILQSEESSNVMAGVRSFSHSISSLAKELGTVRQSIHGQLPEHHNHLQGSAYLSREKQSQVDVYQWRMDKMSSKSSVLKFDLSNLQSTLDSTTDIATCYDISQCLSSDSQMQVSVLKHELSDRLTVWSSFVSRVNTTLQDIQRVESLYMNEKRLTIEELLDEILSIYSADLLKLTQTSNELITEGSALLDITGDLYGSAIKHGIVSLQNSMKHITRLAGTRTNKLRDTMSAILEFESGMKSLNQWFKTTESSLKCSLHDWQDSTVLGSQQYLQQLEKDIKHHSRTVTAVINLCSLLQYDRDAGYDHTVKQELSAVRERLNNRWKKLCDKIIERKDELHEVSQAWKQMRSQTDSLIVSLTKYKHRCEDHTRSRVLHHRAKSSQLEEFSNMLKECEAKHEDMRLLNNRHRFLIRQNMLDSSGCIKNAVQQCTELWDAVYQTLKSIVKEMRTSHEAWTDFVKDREVLLAKISNLSLQLKTKQMTHQEVTEKLRHYQLEVDELFGEPVAHLRASCTTEEHRKLDNMIQELTASIDTLLSELRPVDDLQPVEEQLDIALNETEHIEHDLESTTIEVRPILPTLPVDLYSNQHATVASGKVADLERRVNQMAENASLRRKIRPTLNGSLDRRYGSTDSLDSVESLSRAPSVVSSPETNRLLMASQHQPLILTPYRASSASVGAPKSLSRSPIKFNDRERSKSALVNLIGSRLKAKHNMIGSSPLKSKPRVGFANQDGAYASPNHLKPAISMPNVNRCNWLQNKHPDKGSSATTQQTDPVQNTLPSSAVESTSRGRSLVQGPFQMYMKARQRSLSRDRTEHDQPKLTTRARSLSLERDYSRNPKHRRTQSYQSSRHAPHSPNFHTNTLPALTVDTSTHNYLPSVAPLSSARRSPVVMSPVTASDLTSEQQSVMQIRQIEQDIRHTLHWIDNMEVMSTTHWSSPPSTANYHTLIQQCKQYNEVLSQYHNFKSLVMSINLVADLNDSHGAERDRLNTRWSEVSVYFPTRQQRLQTALADCQQLKKEVNGFNDSVTHSELKLLGGTHTKKSIQSEVRLTMSTVRSFISLLTSILGDCSGRGKQILSTLRGCEQKCSALLS